MSRVRHFSRWVYEETGMPLWWGGVFVLACIALVVLVAATWPEAIR